jgi:hypothetical protein
MDASAYNVYHIKQTLGASMIAKAAPEELYRIMACFPVLSFATPIKKHRIRESRRRWKRSRGTGRNAIDTDLSIAWRLALYVERIQKRTTRTA